MHAGRQRRLETKKPEVEHKHLAPVAVLTMHAITSLLYMFNLCRPIEKCIYIMLVEKPRITRCPAAKHPKHNKLAVTDIGEKLVDFFHDTAQA